MNVPDVEVDLSVGCIQSGLANDRATAPRSDTTGGLHLTALAHKVTYINFSSFSWSGSMWLSRGSLYLNRMKYVFAPGINDPFI